MLNEKEMFQKNAESVELLREKNKRPETLPSLEKEKSFFGKANDFIENIRMKNKEAREKRGGTNFEKIVSRGVLAFMVASALSTYPQFEAVAADESIAKSEKVLKVENRKNDLDEAISKFNKDLDDFSSENLKERKSGAYFANNIYDAESENGIYSTIDILPEGGIVVGFNGDLKKISQIPKAFSDRVKYIKDNPTKAITEQLLGLIGGSTAINLRESTKENNSKVEESYK
jgi:hypothetical protein